MAAETAERKPPGKLGAEKPTQQEQRRRFIEAVQATGAGESVEVFRAALRRIV